VQQLLRDHRRVEARAAHAERRLHERVEHGRRRLRARTERVRHRRVLRAVRKGPTRPGHQLREDGGAEQEVLAALPSAEVLEDAMRAPFFNKGAEAGASGVVKLGERAESLRSYSAESNTKKGTCSFMIDPYGTPESSIDDRRLWT
jgi:hypothetical protein